ncbi:MAG: Na+/H+ antiporter NhaC family protein [Bacteroidales bacterium]|nr:Na+/H+ antiporter NhaC family protein [Bacteroidales bacterium]
MQQTNSLKPSFKLSMIPVVSLVILLIVNVKIFGDEALDGSIQLVLLLATGITCGLSMFRLKTPWSNFEKGFVHSVANSTPAILVLLLIGAMAGTWMMSGIIPSMIYYGLQVINPTIFLATACAVAAVISVSTGSSWTTIATVGVGLLGVGKALGFDSGWIAGAIISGAYFGDKVSPLSETTNMAATTSGANLFSHIKYMMITTVPSFTITLIIFFLYGIFGDHNGDVKVEELTGALLTSYNITPFVFIIPAIILMMIAKKIPAIVVLFTGVIFGGVSIIIFQPHLISQITPEENGIGTLIMGPLKAAYGSVSISTGSEMLDSLVKTKGMSGMLNTVWLIICAMCFGGALEGSGMLQAITDKLVSMMKTTFSTVASTSCACLFLNFATGDQYISILLPGRMFSSIYKKQGYKPELLSRTLEDSATVTSVLIPWNSCGMAQSSVLGVATLTYLPFCFFNIISPIMTLIVAALRFKIVKNENHEYEEDDLSLMETPIC